MTVWHDSDQAGVPDGAGRDVPGVVPGVGAGLQVEGMAELVEGLGEIGEVGAGAELEHLVQAYELGRLGGRRFAHEVNNLVGAIAGRAQRAVMSGDPQHVQQALSIAAESGNLVLKLCEMFMVQRCGDDVDAGVKKSDNQVGFEGVKCFAARGLRGAHGYAVDIVGGCDGVGGASGDDGGVDFVIDLSGWDGVVFDEFMGEAELGQVLVNLYLNAVRGIEVGAGGGARIDGAGGVWGVVGLWVFADEDGYGVVVEDSGIGFGGEGIGNGSGRDCGYCSQHGHGLGLGICVELCTRFGVVVETGDSERLGGGLVRLYKQYS